jgi:hypothetical protein
MPSFFPAPLSLSSAAREVWSPLRIVRLRIPTKLEAIHSSPSRRSIRWSLSQ